MPSCLSPTICLPLIGRLGRRASGQPTNNRPHSPIHTLNDDALLNIFYLYRLDILDEYDEAGDLNADWDGQRWWYKLAQVCRQWRYLILASPLRLDLHLLCTHGVPIVDMLAHSPPLPLTICYRNFARSTTEKDEKGILLALRHSDRVHCIGLWLPAPKLQKIVTAMDKQFPILERMFITSRTEADMSLVLPRTFQAPQLHHLGLMHAALPIGSPLLTTTVGLVSLWLVDIPPSAYFPPTYFLTRLSLMPQLENLAIEFHSPLPNDDVEIQLLHTPIIMHITLPNLCEFWFKGVSAYLEGLLAWISAPVLGTLQIQLFSQLTFTVPHLLQFMDTSETLSFSGIHLAFHDDFADLVAFRLEGQRYYPFWVRIMCRHLDRQVSSAVQILDVLQPVLTVVEKLTLSHEGHNRSSEWHNEVDRTRWRQLLRLFSNLKTLHVQNELIRYSGTRDPFTSFINKRQVAGHPVNLTIVDHSEFSS